MGGKRAGLLDYFRSDSRRNGGCTFALGISVEDYGASVGGAIIGTLFHKTVKLLKKVAWPTNKSSSTSSKPWRKCMF